MDPDDILEWRRSKTGSFTVHDVAHEFEVPIETAWSALEKIEDLEGYRDVSGPYSLDPKTDGAVRDPGVRYKIKNNC